jgi:RNA polymerase sigma-70 factor (ECF subfamily)
MEPDALLTWTDLQQKLKVFIYRKVKDKELAADLVQDVFIKAQTNLSQLKDKKKFSAWVYRITRHVVMDHFRRNATIAKPVDVDWESATHEFNECVAYCLSVLLERLPEKYRIALKLTELENLSQYELAERLKISYSGARSRVQRARKMLKENINALYSIKTDSYGNIIACENRTSCCCKEKS